MTTNGARNLPDKVSAGMPEAAVAATRTYRPLTDIIETSEGVSLMVEMPGVDADSVDITLDKRVLTIRGKVKPTQPEKLEPVYTEYGEGDFERVFTLNEDFDPKKITAELHNGVLTVTLPRAPESKPRKIKVKAA